MDISIHKVTNIAIRPTDHLEKSDSYTRRIIITSRVGYGDEETEQEETMILFSDAPLSIVSE